MCRTVLTLAAHTTTSGLPQEVQLAYLADGVCLPKPYWLPSADLALHA